MIIGISGKMRCGKTTLANHLADLCGGRRRSFADALRDEVWEQFSVAHVTQQTTVGKAQKVNLGFRQMTVRELLQWWGALRREGNVNYWVDKLLASLPEGEITIIDDVRYRNEAAAIRAAGGLVIRLDPYDGWEPGVGADHLSETDLDHGFAFDWRSGPEFGTLKPLAEQLVALI